MGNLSNPDAYSGIVKGLGGGGGSSVDFPTDITNPQDGQLLKYDATSEKWVNSDNEPCVVDVIKTEEDRQATSDDVTNYINDDNSSPIVEGSNYHVTSFDISINDLELNKMYRFIDVRDDTTVYINIILFSYQAIDNIYQANIMYMGGGFQRLYVANKNLNLKKFTLALNPS